MIVLSPPEKLVIETRASGGYGQFDWQRNGVGFGTSPFIVTLQEFPNFFEIFVREPTNPSDVGVYEAEVGLEIDFIVTPYSEYMYVILCVVFVLNTASHSKNLLLYARVTNLYIIMYTVMDSKYVCILHRGHKHTCMVLDEYVPVLCHKK